MIPKPLLAILVGSLLVVPIALVLVMGVASLLAGMGDELGALVLRRVALGLGLIWALTGVLLVAVLGISALEKETALHGSGVRSQESGISGQQSEVGRHEEWEAGEEMEE